MGVIEPGLNGLVDGVGLEVLEITPGAVGAREVSPAGENRDGNVPARVLPRVGKD